MWKTLRIAILLFILATVALDAWRGRRAATDWQDTLHVAVYPINADGSSAAARHIASLDGESFGRIEQFFADEARRFGATAVRPVRLSLQAQPSGSPPAAPVRGNAFDNMVWSLSLRFWVWRLPAATPRPDVRLFVHYWDPARSHVPASHGLERGRIAIAHVFASAAERGGNEVVMAHELLHTLGATDKYHPVTLEPRFPEGFADPTAQPRDAQRHCELMAGRFPGGGAPPRQPAGLRECLIGITTAREIGLTARN